MYSECGLLVRSNDGQHPITLNELKESIEKIVLDKHSITIGSDKVLNLGGLLPNNGPTYSATLLSNNKYNVLWYFYQYSEPFVNTELPKRGKRTTLVAIVKPSRIFVSGLCLWDADSNDRNSALIPNNPNDNKATPHNDFAMRKIFDGIGNYKYNKPEYLNNFSWYNPLIRPDTDNSIAKNEMEICTFLKKAGDLKEFWVSHLDKEAKGFNDKFANYVTDTYGSGVESEVLISPKYDSSTIYGSLKFSIEDIETMAFITDGLAEASHSLEDYEEAVINFIHNGTGWIHAPSEEKINCLPIINIKRVALPNVGIDSTSPSQVGDEWKKYLRKDDSYQSPLTLNDFNTIREGKN